MAIGVICKDTIKAGQKAAYLAHMAEMIRLTHEEDGCLAYDLYEPEGGSETDLVMIELWETKEALDKHMASEHFQRLIPGGDIYKAAPTDIKIFSKVS
ncbi:MAG: antibiotic biosynthesis monooxygenase [Clostridiales Family XIII bacterium]|jgi:quinol monooxygenase YgiN|nr:antibiotic biosynthesis monooxygenase [Clostridiales Family XIII bacterium]